MNNDNKPPMFGPSAVIDPVTYEPLSGKSVLMNELMAEITGKPEALAATIIGNCTTTLPMKFKFDPSCICLARHRCAWSKRCGRKTSNA